MNINNIDQLFQEGLSGHQASYSTSEMNSMFQNIQTQIGATSGSASASQAAAKTSSIAASKSAILVKSIIGISTGLAIGTGVFFAVQPSPNENTLKNQGQVQNTVPLNSPTIVEEAVVANPESEIAAGISKIENSDVKVSNQTIGANTSSIKNGAHLFIQPKKGNANSNSSNYGTTLNSIVPIFLPSCPGKGTGNATNSNVVNNNVSNEGNKSLYNDPLNPTESTLTETSASINSKGDSSDLTFGFIPNAITPNGDGFNDVWYIPVSGAIASFDLQIIDLKTNSLVFKSKNPEEKWTGTIFNNPQKLITEGNFAFLLKVVSKGGKQEKKSGIIYLNINR